MSFSLLFVLILSLPEFQNLVSGLGVVVVFSLDCFRLHLLEFFFFTLLTTFLRLFFFTFFFVPNGISLINSFFLAVLDVVGFTVLIVFSHIQSQKVY